MQAAVVRTVEAIEQLRVAARLTRTALCKAAKVHPRTYWRSVSGRTSPNIRTLLRLNAALTGLLADGGNDDESSAI